MPVVENLHLRLWQVAVVWRRILLLQTRLSQRLGGVPAGEEVVGPALAVRLALVGHVEHGACTDDLRTILPRHTRANTHP